MKPTTNTVKLRCEACGKVGLNYYYYTISGKRVGEGLTCNHCKLGISDNEILKAARKELKK